MISNTSSGVIIDLKNLIPLHATQLAKRTFRQGCLFRLGSDSRLARSLSERKRLFLDTDNLSPSQIIQQCRRLKPQVVCVDESKWKDFDPAWHAQKLDIPVYGCFREQSKEECRTTTCGDAHALNVAADLLCHGATGIICNNVPQAITVRSCVNRSFEVICRLTKEVPFQDEGVIKASEAALAGVDYFIVDGNIAQDEDELDELLDEITFCFSIRE